MILGLWI